jgi:hypothetical protein
MKVIGAFAVHFFVAALAVPMLTLFSASLAYSLLGHFFSTDASPQMFYSDHFISVAIIVGLCLGYAVCDMVTRRGAVWVWVPFTLIFLLRVLTWKESVLFHSGVFGHFFTEDCQIQNWRDPTLASRCGDKLLLTQAFIGSMAYSIGSFLHGAVRRRIPERGKSAPLLGTLLLKTRLNIGAAIALTSYLLMLAVHSGTQFGHTQSGWLLPLDYLLHGWPLIAANVAFYGYLCWVGFGFIRGTKGRERVFMIGWAANILLSPIEILRPEWAAAIKYIGMFGLTVALFAALSLLRTSFAADPEVEVRRELP